MSMDITAGAFLGTGLWRIFSFFLPTVTGLSTSEKKTGGSGRHATPEPAAASVAVTPTPAAGKRKRRVNASAAGSSPSSPAAKRRRT